MAKKIMIQGTMSGAGKSLICAGLCRIFKQDGYRVAPFKSQNMALNSFITEDGLEMGRAQVVQAEAAGISPTVQMNPILLKPTNDVGSQVIVNGEVLGNMSAREYFAYKKKLIPDIQKAFRKLEEEYDIIVIEGAGSPAEINLKSEDIVNMGLAEMVDAPVLLVGDIDRGGVFAQLLGTMMLLEEKEQARVKGLIINKFRGDKTILDPGIEMLEDKAHIPVVGVIPYTQAEIEEEDSLTERFANPYGKKAPIEIAVIRLPRISNYTDFMLLENHPAVSLRYVKRKEELKNPDMILLPGTKNTMEDLRWLRQSGLEGAMLKAARKGTVIFGICGGYQMLGEMLRDPDGIESAGELRGMGLLPIETYFSGEKKRTRVKGRFSKASGILRTLEGLEFEGYEIHMGETKYLDIGRDRNSDSDRNGDRDSNCDRSGEGKQAAYMTEIFDSISGRQTCDGCSKENVYGTYVHGILDTDKVVGCIVTELARRKGISLEKAMGFDLREFKETQYDLLADALRENMDMEAIYEILRESETAKTSEITKMPEITKTVERALGGGMRDA